MLKSIDVLIGLTVIMLALSMAVTVITQFVITVLNSRGRHLRRGLVDLLGLLDPDLTGTTARSIANTILTHRLVSATGKRLGSVVHREEFTKLLLHLAAGDDKRLGDEARGALKRALTANGVADPEATLKSIRTVALQLETASPELAANARQSLAILQEARSDYVAKLNGWFDQTIDRVSQRFASSTRTITFVAGFLIAATLQVDTLMLVNRLSADDKMRDAFVAQATSMPAAPPAAAAAPEASSSALANTEADRRYLGFLARYGVITVPRSSDEWVRGWATVNWVGVLVTGLLLSLGAPFWYNSLGHLLQLRSALAAKDDQQRAERQGTDGGTGGGGTAKAARLPGERGGLTAAG
jgi:hypothetical protein